MSEKQQEDEVQSNSAKEQMEADAYGSFYKHKKHLPQQPSSSVSPVDSAFTSFLDHDTDGAYVVPPRRPSTAELQKKQWRTQFLDSFIQYRDELDATATHASADMGEGDENVLSEDHLSEEKRVAHLERRKAFHAQWLASNTFVAHSISAEEASDEDPDDEEERNKGNWLRINTISLGLFRRWCLLPSPRTRLEQELYAVQQECAALLPAYGRCLSAGDSDQFGLRLLLLLVADLLGRDTLPGRLFVCSVRSLLQDDAPFCDVRNWVKFLAVAFIIVTNIGLFVWCIELLRVVPRRRQWWWLTTATVVVGCDIFLVAPLEALWLHYALPLCIRDTVHAARQTVEAIFQRFDVHTTASSEDRKTPNGMMLDQYLQQQQQSHFNITHFQYLSTNLARRFPHHIASQIVLSYESVYPRTVCSQRWPAGGSLAEYVYGAQPWSSERGFETIGYVLFSSLVMRAALTLPVWFQRLCVTGLLSLAIWLVSWFILLLLRASASDAYWTSLYIAVAVAVVLLTIVSTYFLAWEHDNAHYDAHVHPVEPLLFPLYSSSAPEPEEGARIPSELTAAEEIEVEWQHHQEDDEGKEESKEFTDSVALPTSASLSTKMKQFVFGNRSKHAAVNSNKEQQHSNYLERESDMFEAPSQHHHLSYYASPSRADAHGVRISASPDELHRTPKELRHIRGGAATGTLQQHQHQPHHPRPSLPQLSSSGSDASDDDDDDEGSGEEAESSEEEGSEEEEEAVQDQQVRPTSRTTAAAPSTQQHPNKQLPPPPAPAATPAPPATTHSESRSSSSGSAEGEEEESESSEAGDQEEGEGSSEYETDED